MLSDIFETPFALARHRATLFGPHLDEYVAQLHRAGHPAKVARRNAQQITSFGEFLSRCHVRTIIAVRSSAVDDFVEIGRRRIGRAKRTAYGPARHILDGFLRHLGDRGLWKPQLPEPVEPLDGFYRSLKEEAGLRPNTVAQYRHFVGKFLQHLGIDGSAVAQWRRLKIPAIDAFITSAGQTYSRRSMWSLCATVRGLLRYLFRVGIASRDMAPTVLVPRIYAMERIPCALPWKTVRGIIRAADTTSPRGRRDRAILLLLVTYGVRPGEVVQLRLDDIDWRANTIHFSRCKAGRPLAFPLTTEAGEAIATYLRSGRPTTSVREVFVRAKAPHVALSRGSVVSVIVRRHLIWAGIPTNHKGAYVIRHSLAVNLVRKKHPLKTVTDMLGHRDPHVAFQYTKLALDDLHGVALPVKEVLP